MSKNFFLWLIIFQTAGTAIAWWHNLQQFVNFFSYEGTLAFVSDPIIPHPLQTPCFWGGVGFIVALLISIKFYQSKPSRKLIGWYSIYLAAGSLFAWNFAGRDLYHFFIGDSTGEPIVGCSGLVITNPFTTACFAGAFLFLISFLIAFGAYLKR